MIFFVYILFCLFILMVVDESELCGFFFFGFGLIYFEKLNFLSLLVC